MQIKDLIKELERFPDNAQVLVKFPYDALPELGENFTIERVETESGEPVIVAVEI